MQKISILWILFQILSTFPLSAQNFSVSSTSQTNYSFANKASESSIWVINSSSKKSLKMKYRVITQKLPANWEYEISDNANAYPGDTSAHYFTLTDSVMIMVNVIPDSLKLGTGFLAMRFFEVGDSSHNKVVNWTFVSCRYDSNVYLNYKTQASICPGDSVQLIAPSGFDTYLWSDYSTAHSLYAKKAKTYSVTASSNTGCPVRSYPVKVELKQAMEPSICQVTVDSGNNHNMVIWDKPNKTNVKSYTIYKESSVSGSFIKIGEVGVNGLSQFIDTTSNPMSRSDRYKISVQDSCGNEKMGSKLHKTIHLTVSSGPNASWNLNWNSYEGFPVSSYLIKRADSLGHFSLVDSVPGSVSSFSDLKPPKGTTAYIIEVINPNGCYLSTTSNRWTFKYTGVNNITPEQSIFQVVPNPNKGTFKLSGIDPESRIEVWDLVGHKVFQDQGENVIRLQLCQGTYILKVIEANSIRFQKILINY